MGLSESLLTPAPPTDAPEIKIPHLLLLPWKPEPLGAGPSPQHQQLWSEHPESSLEESLWPGPKSASWLLGWLCVPGGVSSRCQGAGCGDGETALCSPPGATMALFIQKEARLLPHFQALPLGHQNSFQEHRRPPHPLTPTHPPTPRPTPTKFRTFYFLQMQEVLAWKQSVRPGSWMGASCLHLTFAFTHMLCQSCERGSQTEMQMALRLPQNKRKESAGRTRYHLPPVRWAKIHKSSHVLPARLWGRGALRQSWRSRKVQLPPRETDKI